LYDANVAQHNGAIQVRPYQDWVKIEGQTRL
jgi:hypothetical protein